MENSKNEVQRVSEALSKKLNRELSRKSVELLGKAKDEGVTKLDLVASGFYANQMQTTVQAVQGTELTTECGGDITSRIFKETRELILSEGFAHDMLCVHEACQRVFARDGGEKNIHAYQLLAVMKEVYDRLQSEI